jgi:hypothetical protein
MGECSASDCINTGVFWSCPFHSNKMYRSSYIIFVKTFFHSNFIISRQSRSAHKNWTRAFTESVHSRSFQHLCGHVRLLCSECVYAAKYGKTWLYYIIIALGKLNFSIQGNFIRYIWCAHFFFLMYVVCYIISSRQPRNGFFFWGLYTDQSY